jgi:hypothetical protein
VYAPLEVTEPPALPSCTLQVQAVSLEPVTVQPKLCVAPVSKETVAGEIETVTGGGGALTVTVDVARFVVSA